MMIFHVDGPPVAWKAHAGYGRKSFNPLFREKEHVQWQLKKQYDGPLLENPLSCEFIFYLPIPKSISKKKYEKMVRGEIKPIKRPDRDNLAKFLSDCMIGIIIKDDSIIVDGPIRKLYADHPKTLIMIEEL